MRPSTAHGAQSDGADVASVRNATSAPSPLETVRGDHKVQPLTNSNYYGFVVDIAAVLRSKGVYDFVTTDLVDKIKARRGLGEWEMRNQLAGDQEALGIIQHHCSSTYKNMIKDCATSKEAWDLLAKHFAEDSLDGHTDLLDEILDLRFSWSEGMDHFIQLHQNLKLRLEAAGSKQDEAFYIAALLRGLPSEFQVFAKIVRSSPSVKLDEVKSKLHTEYRALSKQRKDTAVEARAEEKTDTRMTELANLLIQGLVAQSSNSGASRGRKRHRGHQSNERHRGHQSTEPCPHCQDTNMTHLPQNCWANPASREYRPNWPGSSRGGNQGTSSSRREPNSDRAGALLSKIFGGAADNSGNNS
jgi:hypothetical protein